MCTFRRDCRVAMIARCLALLALTSTCVVQTVVGLEIVALSGTSPSVDDPSFVAVNFLNPAINNSGVVSFISGPQTGGSGLFLGPPGNLRQVVRLLDQLPNFPTGVRAIGFGTINLNNSGQVVVACPLDGPGINASNGLGIFRGSAADFKLVVRLGDAAPGINNGTFLGLGAGQFGFVAQPSGLIVHYGEASFSQGIWAETTDQRQLVALTGKPAPGTSGNFHDFGDQLVPPGSSAHGEIGFSATIAEGISRPSALFVGTPSSLQLVARAGTAAPGTNVSFLNFSNPAFNAVGDYLFSSRLQGPNLGTSSDDGVWLGSGTSLQLLAREGQQVPNTPAGNIILSLQSAGLNNLGEVAMTCGLDGPAFVNTSGQGIFVAKPGSMRKIVFGGENVPGGGGLTFKNFAAPTLNDNGIVAFFSNLDGSGTPDGIFASLPSGELITVAKTGDQMLINNSLKTILRISFDSARGFNDRNQLAFTAEFTDRTKAILVTTVPEPGVTSVLAIAAAVLPRRRYPN